MTQKRGMGRGLGALIGGAGSTARGDDELRTRTPRTAPEGGEKAAGARPVDMFFSGDPVESDGAEAAPRERLSRDLGGDMARAAKERRARSTAAKKTGAAAKKAAEKAGENAAEEPSQKDTEKAAAGTKAAKGSKQTPAKKTAATTAKKTPARSTVRKAPADKAQSDKAQSAAAPASTEREDSPVVDVEEVQYTPARKASGAKAAVAEKTAAPGDPAPAGDSEPASEAEGGSDSAEADSSGTETQLVPVPGAEFAEIPIQEIRENPRNPRTMFDDDELDELAFSLREVGVLQPVVVRPISVTDHGESFELVMGERRWRAAQRAGLRSIPAIIRETSDDDLLRDALLENLHRSQLNPLEEAAAYQQLLEDFECTQDELASRIGRSRPQISNTLRLMRLPALVQKRLASGALSAGHARALLTLEDPALMEELAARIVAEGLSVRAVERLVARGVQPTERRPVRRSSYDPYVVDLTSKLSKGLEVPVRVDVGKRKSKVTLEFTDVEQLERLVSRLDAFMATLHEDSSEDHAS